MLGDLGADVVKVEPPGGDGFRSQRDLWALSARHKRSAVCDQQTEQGRAQVRRLIGASDVVVTNLPGGSAERRGLSWEQVSVHAPHVVLVNLTGFGAGPLEDRPGNGTVAEAFAGLSHLTGLPDGAPLSPSVPLGDAVAAGFGVGGVVAAAW
ncbi:MAG: putative Formyl-CoA transferase, partial [Frankiales bacterium]|nr:putative Formyl-CoA transferase [Frankiales bacterium]